MQVVRSKLAVPVLAAVSLLAGPAATTALPERVNASFLMSAQGVEVARTRWQIAPSRDNVLVFESVSRSIGIARLFRDETIEERSHFRIDSGRVMPIHYAFSRHGGKRERKASIEFDWARGEAVNRINDETWTMAIQPGIQDKLSYLLALMNQLERGRPLEPVSVSDGGKVKRYRLKRVGSEPLETVVGPLDTVRVVRTVDGDDRRTDVWLAPVLGHLPVRMEHREDGEVVTLVLETLEGLAPR